MPHDVLLMLRGQGLPACGRRREASHQPEAIAATGSSNDSPPPPVVASAEPGQ
jgi:hypothetical protein